MLSIQPAGAFYVIKSARWHLICYQISLLAPFMLSNQPAGAFYVIKSVLYGAKEALLLNKCSLSTQSLIGLVLS